MNRRIEMPVFRPRLGTAFTLAFVLCCCVATERVIPAAQETFPPGRTDQEIEQQIERLQAQARFIDALMRENARRILGAADDLVSGFGDALLGPFLGREREYVQLQKSIQELDLALRSGSGTFVASKARDVYEQMSSLVKRIAGTLAAQPKDIVKQVWESRKDVSRIAQGANRLAPARLQHDALVRVLGRINSDIDRLQKEQFSAPYSAPNRATSQPAAPKAPLAVPPLSTTAPASPRYDAQLDGAIRFLDWLDKGNRSFADAAAKEIFYEEFPDLRKFDAVAELRSPADDVKADSVVNVSKSSDNGGLSLGVNGRVESVESKTGASVSRDPQVPNGRSTSAGSPSGLDEDTIYQRWRNNGDRAFSDATERNRFYADHPELRQFSGVAAWRSPMTEVDEAIANGAVRVRFRSDAPGDSGPAATQPSQNFKSSLASNANRAHNADAGRVSFTPPQPGTSNYAAWQQTQERVAVDMLGAGASFTPPRAGTAEYAAWQQTQAKVAVQILATGGSFTPPKPGTAEYSAWQRTQEEVSTEMLASGGSFKPPSRGTTEYAAWQQNQAKVAAETLSATAQFTPPKPDTPEYAAWKANESKIAAETRARSSSAPDWSNNSGAGVDFGTYTKTSDDKRLRAVLTWSNRSGSNLTPQYTGKWVVYDDANGGRLVGSYDNVALFNGGKFSVSNHADPTRAAMGVNSPDAQYSIYSADRVTASSGTSTLNGAAGGALVTGRGNSVQVSPDGRLRAVLETSGSRQYGGPQSGFSFSEPVSRWSVYDDAHGGIKVGSYDNVTLLNDGKFNGLTNPTCTIWPCTGPDGKALGPRYESVDTNQKFGATSAQTPRQVAPAAGTSNPVATTAPRPVERTAQPAANPGGILVGNQQYKSEPGLADQTEELLRQIDDAGRTTSK
jgi:hypothetical protein